MEKAQQYVKLAEEAGRDGSHVASIMNYRTAVELATSREELKLILQAAVTYANGRLKKPLDQYATYIWAQKEIVTKLEGDPLEKIVVTEIAKIMQSSE